MRHENRKILYAHLFRLMHRHRIGRSGRFKADGEEHNFFIGILLRDLHSIERRVNDADIAAVRFHQKQILLGARHRSMSPNEQKMTFGRDAIAMRFVDQLERSNANRTAGTVDKLNLLREKFVDTEFHNRVRLTAANLH